MAKVSKILITLMALLAPAIALCVNDYNRLAARSRMFFDNSEWTSAKAMYILMLEEKPEVADTYGRAVVCYTLSGDTIGAVDLLTQAMKHEIPLDTVLANVRDAGFSIGRGDLYCDYLYAVKANCPWLSRPIDNHLMRYYAFRQNGAELVHYAQIMLAGLPDNTEFLRMLAQGLLLQGDADGAIDAWKRVIALHPDNYDTVLDLANCYDALGRRDDALHWMQRALELRPTPYVRNSIDRLTSN